MYNDLPEPVQRKVRDYLLANDFKAAKQVHDSWLNGRQIVERAEWGYSET